MTALGRLPEHLSVDDPSAPFLRRSWRYTTRRVLRRIRELLGDDPLFLPIVLRATPIGTARRITDETELVIEGFPRSGNTFATFALQHASDAAGVAVVVASHVHTPSQVRLALTQRFPTLVLVRPPLDTVASLLIAAPHVRFDAALAEYVHHYREIWPWHDRCVVATFDQVITDFGAVTKRLNAQFGTDFPCFETTSEHVAEVFAAIERNHEILHGGTENVVPRPSVPRQAEKAWLVEQLSGPCHRDLLAVADAVYADFARVAASR